MSTSESAPMTNSESANSPSFSSAHLSALSPTASWFPQPRTQRQYSSSVLERGPVLNTPRAFQFRASSPAALGAGFSQSWDQGRDGFTGQGGSPSAAFAGYSMHMPPSQFLQSPVGRRPATSSASTLHSTLLSPTRPYSAMSYDDLSMGIAWSPGLALTFGSVPSPRSRNPGFGPFDWSALTPMQRDFPRSNLPSDLMMAPITPTIATMPKNGLMQGTICPMQTKEEPSASTDASRAMLSPPRTGNKAPGGLTIRVPPSSLFASSRFGEDATGSTKAFAPPSPNSANESFSTQPVPFKSHTQGHAHTTSAASGSTTLVGSLPGEDVMGKVVIIGPTRPFVDQHSSENSKSAGDQQDASDTASNSSRKYIDSENRSLPRQEFASRLMAPEHHGSRAGAVDPYCSPSQFLQMTLHEPHEAQNSQNFEFPAVSGTAIKEEPVAFPFGDKLDSTNGPNPDAWTEGEAEDDEDEDGDGEDDDGSFDEAGIFKHEQAPGTSASTSRHFSIFAPVHTTPAMVSTSTSQSGTHHCPQRRPPGSNVAPIRRMSSTASLVDIRRSSAGTQDVQGGAKRNSRPNAAAVRNRSASVLITKSVVSNARQMRTANSTDKMGPSSSSGLESSSVISAILGDNDDSESSRSRTSSLRSNFSNFSMSSGMDPATLYQSAGDDLDGLAFEHVEYYGVQSGLPALTDLAQKCRDTRDNKEKVSIMEKFANEWMDNFYAQDEQGTVNRAYMNQCYRAVCRAYHLHPLNPSNFGKLVRTQFAGVTTRRLGPRGNSRYHYTGLIAKFCAQRTTTASRDALVATPLEGPSAGVGTAAIFSENRPGNPKTLKAVPARKSAAPMVPSSSRFSVTSLHSAESSPWQSCKPELRRTFSESYSHDPSNGGSSSNPFYFEPPSTANDDVGANQTSLGLTFSMPTYTTQAQSTGMARNAGGPDCSSSMYQSPMVGVESSTFDAGHAGMNSQASAGPPIMPDGCVGQTGFPTMSTFANQLCAPQQPQYNSGLGMNAFQAPDTYQVPPQSAPGMFAFGTSALASATPQSAPANFAFTSFAEVANLGGETEEMPIPMPFSWDGFSQNSQQQQCVPNTAGMGGQGY
ncbi:hypothetical protein A4X06_0g3984 [Tilletia controversa]|uniref:RFX-type winged-helix domain-containing protein n=1 Tax=Tilletia controversa TaxID=13291 RepID=A0A8X7MTJ7_9BASI|nr:hypothetical protein CF328_g526 [Tilletia controversa]KAE8248066.1 hypothetical protein A4X06_0g3984 [Tilletia controversa]